MVLYLRLLHFTTFFITHNLPWNFLVQANYGASEIIIAFCILDYLHCTRLFLHLCNQLFRAVFP